MSFKLISLHFICLLLLLLTKNCLVACYSEEEINEAVDDQILTYGSLLRLQNVMTKYM